MRCTLLVAGVTVGLLAGCSPSRTVAITGYQGPGCPPPANRFVAPTLPHSSDGGIEVYRVRLHKTVTFRERTAARVRVAELAVMRSGTQPEASGADNLARGQFAVLATARSVGSAPIPVLRFRADRVGTFPIFVRTEFHELTRCSANGNPSEALTTGEQIAAYVRVVA
jgi:hypothetical protein